MTNHEIASKLQEYARELRQRRENLYRVKAYRRAAEVVMSLNQPVGVLLNASGRNALEKLPGIGRHLAETITVYVQTGEWHARH
jgi:DNA polymerase/3'-5' exonuclease PolX